jgi:hypothetical protein
MDRDEGHAAGRGHGDEAQCVERRWLFARRPALEREKTFLSCQALWYYHLTGVPQWLMTSRSSPSMLKQFVTLKQKSTV